MFRFYYPEYLYALILLPILIVLYILYNYYKKQQLSKFGNIQVMKDMMPMVSRYRPTLKFTFILLAFASLIIAIARPQFGSKLKEVKRKGVELIIALDVSNSMLAEDILPNRLERAKMAISKLIDKLEDDRIGLIVFAGDAYTQIPITTDYAAVKVVLSSINTNVVPKQGTAIGKAIDLALKSFHPTNNLEKALIIITDGENHEDDALSEVEKATEKKIKIHTIGIGSPTGTPIFMPGPYGQKTRWKDKDGNVVVTKLDENVLKQIAVAANGKYIRASNKDIGLSKLFDEINKMEAKEMDTQIYSDYEDQFQYFILFSLIMLMLDFLILQRKSKWSSRFNLFSEENKK